jgi:hypothetical protein
VLLHLLTAGFGTKLPIANTPACPELAEADIEAEDQGAGYDPTETLAGHCGNGFDIDFTPY